mgnify:CR=1 FL=1
MGPNPPNEKGGPQGRFPFDKKLTEGSLPGKSGDSKEFTDDIRGGRRSGVAGEFN